MTDHRSATPVPPVPPGSAIADLDLRGLRCPLPVLRTRKALAALPAGHRLRVLCTDPLAGIDIPHLVQTTGDTLLEQRPNGTAQLFLIRKR